MKFRRYIFFSALHCISHIAGSTEKIEVSQTHLVLRYSYLHFPQKSQGIRCVYHSRKNEKKYIIIPPFLVRIKPATLAFTVCPNAPRQP